MNKYLKRRCSNKNLIGNEIEILLGKNIQMTILENKRYGKDVRGKSMLFNISFANFNTNILVYQKDDEQRNLRKCFLNQIFCQSKYNKIKSNSIINLSAQVPNLECPKCYPVSYTHFIYDDNRLAFRTFQECISIKLNYKMENYGVNFGRIL